MNVSMKILATESVDKARNRGRFFFMRMVGVVTKM